MTNENPQHPEEPPATPAANEPVWGQPAPKAAWSTTKTVATGAVAVVLAAGAGAAIYAGTSGSHNDGAAQAGAPGAGMAQGGPGGSGGSGDASGNGGASGGTAASPGGGPMGAPDMLHGQFVVADSNGGYTTELTQTGKITALSTTSVTAVSSDDYTHTYIIDANTVSGGGRESNSQTQALAVGDTARIVARSSGKVDTATRIMPADGSASGIDGPGGAPQSQGGMLPPPGVVGGQSGPASPPRQDEAQGQGS